MQLVHIATREASLLSILRNELALSSGLVKRLKWQNAFQLNGAFVHINASVRHGDRIIVDLSEYVQGYDAEDSSLDILYEDEGCLAVEKKCGILVHPSPKCNSGTLANAVLGYYTKTGQACGVHPVTRLDRDTFGVVLFAKNAYIHEKFCEMQKNHRIFKTYHASVFGNKMAKAGLIDLPIMKMPGRSLLRTVAPSGKESRTFFRVLDKFENFSVLELKPITGRTHQLRVHCKYAGFPILGDPQYQSDESDAFSRENGLSSQELCAKKLEFQHPMTGEKICILSHQDVWRGP